MDKAKKVNGLKIRDEVIRFLAKANDFKSNEFDKKTILCSNFKILEIWIECIGDIIFPFSIDSNKNLVDLKRNPSDVLFDSNDNFILGSCDWTCVCKNKPDEIAKAIESVCKQESIARSSILLIKYVWSPTNERVFHPFDF